MLLRSQTKNRVCRTWTQAGSSHASGFQWQSLNGEGPANGAEAAAAVPVMAHVPMYMGPSLFPPPQLPSAAYGYYPPAPYYGPAAGGFSRSRYNARRIRCASLQLNHMCMHRRTRPQEWTGIVQARWINSRSYALPCTCQLRHSRFNPFLPFRQLLQARMLALSRVLWQPPDPFRMHVHLSWLQSRLFHCGV